MKINSEFKPAVHHLKLTLYYITWLCERGWVNTAVHKWDKLFLIIEIFWITGFKYYPSHSLTYTHKYHMYVCEGGREGHIYSYFQICSNQCSYIQYKSNFVHQKAFPKASLVDPNMKKVVNSTFQNENSSSLFHKLCFFRGFLLLRQLLFFFPKVKIATQKYN